MTRPSRAPFDRVQFLPDAVADVVALNERAPLVAREALRLLKQVDQRTLLPQPLHAFSKTGDLSDCGKIVVLVEGEKEHRIVVRDVGGAVEVVEVVCVEERTGDLPYLLAGLRLGRIEEPVRRSDASRRVDRIRRIRSRE